MSKTNDGGTAFPLPEKLYEHSVIEPYGMSLRDYFAAQALAGDWAAQGDDAGGVYVDQSPQDGLELRAQLYYRMADAMIKAREASA